MKQDSRIRTSLTLVAVLCLIAPAHAQETRASPAEPKPARSRDRATELIRREAAARAAEREKAFARLKELAPAPARAPVGVWIVNPGILLEELPTPQDDDEADVIAPPPPRFVVAEQTFNQYILGGTGDPDSRAHLESILTRRIEAIDRQRRLTPDQKTKLLLAGRGDIKRLFDRIEDERRQFELLRTDFRACQRFLRELRPLARTMQQGPFDDGSLFAKTLKTILE
jgi:hypothetical protein